MKSASHDDSDANANIYNRPISRVSGLPDQRTANRALKN